ncbi:uncharacterized protein MONBRDRAFT_32818 [Monosiga brevicollis MX1]|uniref:Methionine aminopeptidase n=1 Tax=Monosiga brevicollis TaxID=81824 RepID=A9V1W2_MONBE|nr:uncharacterized protein MONBRDRAFT_32818 [Monosiga brevicollis MX1]EDQ88513.1 predicted protein [Monosiga brevicollis MX1]|eukprot:XP_001746617.1 hypothetical protein [Monosiga brevicollis MX1]
MAAVWNRSGRAALAARCRGGVWLGLSAVCAGLARREMRTSEVLRRGGISTLFQRRRQTPHNLPYQLVTKAHAPGDGDILAVPEHIARPPYIVDPNVALPDVFHDDVPILPAADRPALRAAGRLAGQTMAHACALAVPGCSTAELNAQVHAFIVGHDAYPSTVNYMAFPAATCTSVNNCIVHGIPAHNVVLQEGDLISIDITVYFQGHHGDLCRTVLVGAAQDDVAPRLVQTAREACEAGIAACGPGQEYSDIARAIETHVEKQGFFVSPYFTGHGIGKHFHQAPGIHHETQVDSASDLRMLPGHVFTIEPIIHETSNVEFEILSDNWTALTMDGSRTSQFEQTIMITETVGKGPIAMAMAATQALVDVARLNLMSRPASIGMS